MKIAWLHICKVRPEVLKGGGEFVYCVFIHLKIILSFLFMC